MYKSKKRCPGPKNMHPFVFPPFPVPLQLLFLIIGREVDLWGLSGPFISALAPRSGFRFWPGEASVLPMQLIYNSIDSIGFCNLMLARSSMVFCSSLLANRIEITPSLYVAATRAVPLSFATRCLQVTLEWLSQRCSALLFRM